MDVEKLDSAAKASKACLLGLCGLVAVPSELCVLAGHAALGKAKLKQATCYTLCYDGTPLETVDKPRHTLAGNISCGRSFLGGVTQPSVERTARLLGWGENFAYTEWSPTPKG